MIAVKRALISVSDKSGLEPLVKKLSSMGVEILSTGGTAKFISSLGVEVKEVQDITGFPEMLEGRVKTLHPMIHAGLLAVRNNASHMSQIDARGIKPIDMVVVNLYPFKKTIAVPDIKLDEAIENIDIGGPAMLRSAAKNYNSVAVLTAPGQYEIVIKELVDNQGRISDSTLARLAVEAFVLTSDYDSCIKDYLKKKLLSRAPQADESIFPKELVLYFNKTEDLRYGENEHQKAALYKRISAKETSISNAKQLHGKPLSYNNVMDLDAAFEAVKDFEEPAACIVKHATACGIASADTLALAFTEALSTDTLSAFGGIVGLNRKADVNTAEAILNAGFIECVIALGYEQGALSRLQSKPNLRILQAELMSKAKDKDELHIRNITGGLLVQERDLQDIDMAQLKIVTQKKPTPDEVDALMFAWKAVKHIRSNAILLARGKKTVGIGAGQMSRVDSVFIAVHKAGQNAKGSVMASDAFFPKQDAVELAINAGVTSIIQPGGSKADDLIIETCDKHNISMVFTGTRHFRH
jgi:phosphoribosylaminoimidazolecarboxamide formyltransferase / IMP cyclohydrolase